MSISTPFEQAVPEAPVRRASPERVGQKGMQTKAFIVQAALGLASKIGLEGLSIGILADLIHMSKSGVFAHFGSREELQLCVVNEYYQHFEHEVFRPAMLAPRGLPRVRELFANWMRRVAQELELGCIFISAAVEFHDRPGAVRDALSKAVHTWRNALNRALRLAKECGHLPLDADEEQIAFEIHALILALHYDTRFLRLPDSMERAQQAFEAILVRHGARQP